MVCGKEPRLGHEADLVQIQTLLRACCVTSREVLNSVFLSPYKEDNYSVPLVGWGDYRRT